MMTINIEIRDCNNISQANIALEKECLNIKYGPNGIGKSTIAKAIINNKEDDPLSLVGLMPFKYSGSLEKIPSITGIDEIKNVLLFDEHYVNQFVFQEDEVLKNSFEIFIKNTEFDAAMAEIEGLLSGLKQAFKDNADIDPAINDLIQIKEAFVSTESGLLKKSSKGYKALTNGLLAKNIPSELEDYKLFFQSSNNAKWLKWQKEGNKYLPISDNCPYCSQSVASDTVKEKIKTIEKQYDPKSVEHLATIEEIIERLGVYFSDSCKGNLKKITDGDSELTSEQETFFINLVKQIATLIFRLQALRGVSFFRLNKVEELEKELTGLKIDLAMMADLNSDKMKSTVKPINSQIDDLIKKIGDLKGGLNKQKNNIRKTIEKNQSEINEFLETAGYKYYVDIVPEKDSYRMKLIHKDSEDNSYVEAASGHLSYGERNAFSLILFMYHALKEKPDLVVLDDPISSFDKNKKYAIIHRLFKGKSSLKGMTILLLTHDIEPAIDMVRVKGTSDQFQAVKPVANFLLSRGGNISEVQITRADIQTFAAICRQNLDEIDSDVIKAIYLRRHYEIIDDRGAEYNLLASALHCRDTPTVQEDGGEVVMDSNVRSNAENKIRETFLPSFDYDALVEQARDIEQLKVQFSQSEIGYEKLQLFRLIAPEKAESRVITKFMNETYHIENEQIMQLNPQKFDAVPEYILVECENLIEGSGAVVG